MVESIDYCSEYMAETLEHLQPAKDVKSILSGYVVAPVEIATITEARENKTGAERWRYSSLSLN